MAAASPTRLDPCIEIDYRAEYIAQELRARKPLTRRRREELIEELDGIAAATSRMREVAREISVRVERLDVATRNTASVFADALGLPLERPRHLELVPGSVD